MSACLYLEAVLIWLQRHHTADEEPIVYVRGPSVPARTMVSRINDGAMKYAIFPSRLMQSIHVKERSSHRHHRSGVGSRSPAPMGTAYTVASVTGLTHGPWGRLVLFSQCRTVEAPGWPGDAACS